MTAVRPVSVDVETVLHGSCAAGSGDRGARRGVREGPTAPADLRAQLTALGCFRLSLPVSHGGAGADLPSLLRVFEALSRADASVGWTVMIGSCAWCDIAGLPRATFDALYADGPDVVIGGVFAPSGVAVAVDGGYRVRGRWAFASGCEDADWLYGNCTEATEDGHRLRTAAVHPRRGDDRGHLGRARDARHRQPPLPGRGRRRFRRSGPRCSSSDEPDLDAPIVRIPAPRSTRSGSRAWRSAPPTAPSRRSAPSPRRRCRCWPGARWPPTGSSSSSWPRPTPNCARPGPSCTTTPPRRGRPRRDGVPLAPEQRARLRAAAAWATDRAAAAIDVAYRAGGQPRLYADHPLQRRLRDIHTIGQHFLVRPDTLTTAGAVLAGQEVDLTVF